VLNLGKRSFSDKMQGKHF